LPILLSVLCLLPIVLSVLCLLPIVLSFLRKQWAIEG
jgi:hypothetical protein